MKSLQNNVSAQIPNKDLKVALQKLQEVQDILKPYLITLSPEQREVMPKMSERSLPFVEKVASYAKNNPELGPAYMDTEELQTELQSIHSLNHLIQKFQKIRSSLGDTIMLAGSEAYMASLAYYNSVKGAAKLRVPGAKAVYDDLKKRLENQEQ